MFGVLSPESSPTLPQRSFDRLRMIERRGVLASPNVIPAKAGIQANHVCLLLID
jgi:hypothetical protein